MTEIMRRKQEAERLERKSKAHALDREFRAGVGSIRTAWVKLAEIANEIHQQRVWLLIGFDTVEDWLSDPGIEVERSEFFRLIQVWREFVELRKVAPARLSALSFSKLQPALPALKTGKASVDEVISDAELLNRQAMRAKYAPPTRPEDDAQQATGAVTSVPTPMRAEAAESEERSRPPSLAPSDNGDDPQPSRCPTCGQWTTVIGA